MIWMIVLMATLLGALLLGLFRMEAGRGRSRGDEDLADLANPGKPCPLCGTPLLRGERVHSVMFMTQTPDKTMDIYGCPHCYRDHPAGRRAVIYDRKCPVCKNILVEGEPVMARVFFRTGKRQHVHVLGCPRCRRQR